MRQLSRALSALAIAFVSTILTAGVALAQEPLRIGVITFPSGPAAEPFGVPAKNAADLLAAALNQGSQIPGYGQKGFGSRPIELVYVDEAGGPTKVATEWGMALGKGHKAVQQIPYGTVRNVDGKVTLANIKYYQPELSSPPDGMKRVDWIRSGFKRL